MLRKKLEFLFPIFLFIFWPEIEYELFSFEFSTLLKSKSSLILLIIFRFIFLMYLLFVKKDEILKRYLKWNIILYEGLINKMISKKSQKNRLQQ